MGLDQHNKVEIERTEQVCVKSKLMGSDQHRSQEPIEQDSIKRSDVRGLEVLISEKSHEFEEIENQSVISKHEESDENKTLKYGTDERSNRSGSGKSKSSQKEQIFGKLEQIMSGGCFPDQQKDQKTDVQDYQTLKYAETDDNNYSHREGVSPLSSSLSSPTTIKEINETPVAQDALDCIQSENEKVCNTVNTHKEVETNLITPRENSEEDPQVSYRTPNTKNSAKEYLDMKLSKEMNKATLQASYDAERRETFSHQFYSNSNTGDSADIKNGMNKSDTQDENIRIYVDQWDSEQTDKKLEESYSSDAFLANESIGIHTAKNSPLESNKKDKEYASSEKYSVTEESAEKNLSGYKNERHAFDYNKSNYCNIKRNLNSTLQENIEKCLDHSTEKELGLRNTCSSQEINENLLSSRTNDEN